MLCIRYKSSLVTLMGLWLAVTGITAVRAAEDKVEAASTRFRTVTPPGGSATGWYEMEIELSVRPASERAGRVTHRVRVEALLAYEVPGASDGKRHWEFFRAAAEVVGLTAGRTILRFYLPPVIVQRDRLDGAPKFWEVKLTGNELAVGNPLHLLSPGLADENVRRSFHEKMAAAGPANDGILQPQYLTPFAEAYPRSTPAFVRREAWP